MLKCNLFLDYFNFSFCAGFSNLAFLFDIEVKEDTSIKTQQKKPYQKNNELVNERIRFKEVLVIGSNGEQLGTMSSNEALRIAEREELDLFCVSPQANPPVCKILDYGKYKFDAQKRERNQNKNSKNNSIKWIKMTPLTADHDLQTKTNNARKLLEKGCKIKAGVFIKGRMMAKQELSTIILNKFIEGLSDISFVEKEPVLEGKLYFCIISPSSKK